MAIPLLLFCFTFSSLRWSYPVQVRRIKLSLSQPWSWLTLAPREMKFKLYMI